jgi:hypothetical protein
MTRRERGPRAVGCKGRRHGAAASLGRAAGTGRTCPSAFTPANRPHCHGDSGEKAPIAGATAPPRRASVELKGVVTTLGHCNPSFSSGRSQPARASASLRAASHISATPRLRVRAVAFHVQTRPCDRPRAGSSILPSFLRSLCSAPAHLFLRSRSRRAASPQRRLPFDLAFMHSIQSEMVSIAFKPHTRRKKVTATTLEHADVLPSWLAITIPARMLCDMTVNVCNAKERR